MKSKEQAGKNGQRRLTRRERVSGAADFAREIAKRTAQNEAIISLSAFRAGFEDFNFEEDVEHTKQAVQLLLGEDGFYLELWELYNQDKKLALQIAHIFEFVYVHLVELSKRKRKVNFKYVENLFNSLWEILIKITNNNTELCDRLVGGFLNYWEKFDARKKSTNDKDIKGDYAKDNPPSETAEPSAASGMRDALNIAVKKARAEVADNAKAELAKVKAGLAEARLLATYEVLVRKSDLNNSAVPEQERLRRAERLLTTYKRLRKINPDFHDDSDQLKAARSITNKANYQRHLAKVGQKAKLAM